MNTFTWFVETIPTNLDPQIAQVNADMVACLHLYSGLLRADEEGALLPDLCETYTVSEDERTYTFTLKEAIYYNQKNDVLVDAPITAEDFVFAFVRIFSKETGSPYRDVFAAVENSSAVYDGSLPVSALGVKALDEKTVEFTLSYADSAFLRALALPAAAPCNEAFFESTKGTYGLNGKSIRSTGSFYLYNWTSTGLFLRRPKEGDKINNLRFVQKGDTEEVSAEELIVAEKCTATLDDSDIPTSMQSISYSDTTWSLLFNCNSVLANLDLRMALASVAMKTDIPLAGVYLGEPQGVIPEELAIEGAMYRDTVGNSMPTLPLASEAYSAALGALSVQEMQGITLLVPDSVALEPIYAALNSAWQRELSLFFSLEVVDEETFYARLETGDYTLALAPVVVETADVLSVLDDFDAAGVTHYASPEYGILLQSARVSRGKVQQRFLAQAEKQLLADCVVVPLFTQQKRLLIDPAVSHLTFDPFGPMIDVTYTEKQ